MSTQILREYLKPDTLNKNRLFVDFICDQCGREHNKQKRHVKAKNFCCQKCASDSKSRAVEVVCDYCKSSYRASPSKLESKSGLHFCSRTCKDNAQKIESGFTSIQPDHYGTSESDYRGLAFRKLSNHCNNCLWKDIPEILEVHHKDSDRNNNDLSNLEILCPRCHVIKHYQTKTGKYACKVVEVKGNAPF